MYIYLKEEAELINLNKANRIDCVDKTTLAIHFDNEVRYLDVTEIKEGFEAKEFVKILSELALKNVGVLRWHREVAE